MELRARAVARLALLVAVAVSLLAAPAALAADLTTPASDTVPPRYFKRDARSVKAIAARTEKVRDERRNGPLQPAAYTKGYGRWQVSFFRHGDEVAQVQIDDATGAVLEQWNGEQVAWSMARGYEGAFGRKLNAPYVWIPLCLLFLAPFVDLRRPWRLLHLDLLVLLGFGVSHVFFNRGEIDLSAPLVYPVLLYLLARVLLAGFRPRAGRGPLLPHVPVAWLLIGVVFLAAFRIGLNVADSNVIDVGYAGVIGADRIVDGDPLYGARLLRRRRAGRHLRPAELPALRAVRAGAALERRVGRPAGGSRRGDRLRPARAAPGCCCSDAGCARDATGSCWGPPWPGRGSPTRTRPSRLRPTRTTRSSRSPACWRCSPRRRAPRGARRPARGAAIAAGAAAKFAPLALAPLFAPAGGAESGPACAWLALRASRSSPCSPCSCCRSSPTAGCGSSTTARSATRPAAPSPFSIWGQAPALDWLQTVVKVAAVGLALLVGLVPRRRDLRQVAALGGRGADRPAAGDDALVLPLRRLVRAVRAAGGAGRVRRPRAAARAGAGGRAHRHDRAGARRGA